MISGAGVIRGKRCRTRGAIAWCQERFPDSTVNQNFSFRNRVRAIAHFPREPS
ncbi:hypothetical protein [Nostoc sp. UHCC 0252]|uniref:hypothetical protein n=1 Tax=Nostoc sp. UHCC 0252 TaxID=3110241 RepID=UPI002B1FD74F|nr:hypothetical protein [Nostoc sp. UHCC 0252]MEA5604694.1 hypothetical protein [Nostoc sp. UHCC 0252]